MGKIYKVYSLISVKASRPHQAHPLMQQRSVAEGASLSRCDSQEKEWEEWINTNSFFSFIILQTENNILFRRRGYGPGAPYFHK